MGNVIRTRTRYMGKVTHSNPMLRPREAWHLRTMDALGAWHQDTTRVTQAPRSRKAARL